MPLDFALVMVAPDRAAYHRGLMSFGQFLAPLGIQPPKVLAPWRAASWAVPDMGEHLEALAESAREARVDWRFGPDLPPARLLVADMDSTMIGCECLDEMADYAGKKPEIAEITERAMRGELDFDAALLARLGALKGLPSAVLQTCFDERVRLNPGAKTLVATMKAQGAHCVLASGGFTFFTERVAAAAGFQAHFANRLVLEDGALSGDVERPILGAQAKVDILTREAQAIGATREQTMAIGDGANDAPMIRMAGLGVAYRAKPIVAEAANGRIDFTDLTAALFFQGLKQADFVECD